LPGRFPSVIVAGLDTIFCAAIDIASAEERADYISRACGDDHDLRRRVQEVVSAHFQAGSFLEKPAVAPEATGAFTPSGHEAAAGAGERPGRLTSDT
jgi:hypothetical protein